MKTRTRVRPVRLEDIAADLGISAMAVSKALRGHTDISEETRRRVVERAHALNYRPNALSAQLLSGRTKTIGLVVPSLELTYFAKLAHGASTTLRRQGYLLHLCNSEDSAEFEDAQIQSLLAHRVEGLLLCAARPLENPAELRILADSGVPFVLAGRGQPNFAANFVGSDGVAIGRTATEHLIARGCQRIAHIQGPPIAGSQQRKQGFLDALRHHKRRVNQRLIAGGSDGVDAGYRAMQTLLQSPHPPDGVFAYTDLVAGGAMRAILDAGLRIPQDIAIIGVGNLTFTDLLKISLTTIDQDPLTMGRLAAALVLQLAAGFQPAQPVTQVVPFQLIARESTARPSA